MSDVADMLGIQTNRPAAPLNAAEEAVRFLQEANKAKTDNKGNKPIKKPKGMKREVYDLLGKDGIVPALQSNPVGPVFKNKRAVATRGKWIYAPIESSARGDNQLTFFHWVKADVNYPDYPYAKFNVHLEPVTFGDDEYSSYLNDDNWSKDDTEIVLDICHNLDLRWPIIFDRIQLSTQKSPEEIQARYYTVINKIQTLREQQTSTGIPSLYEKKSSTEFDLEKESKRRLQQDLLFKRTREEEQEELKVREELKAIDSMLKKNKKTVKTNTASNSSITINIALQPVVPPPPPLISQPSDATAVALAGSSSSAVPPGEIGGITLATVTNPLPDINPTPQVNRPCLQSSRLYLTENSLPLAKSMVGKMNSYLKEISIPERPVPTKRVCDLVDQIRKDTITLISLHNSIKKKEKELFLAKGGTIKNANKNAPKVKTEKQTKSASTGTSRKKGGNDNKNNASTNANNADTANQAFDESAVDNSFNADLLPLDGKEDIGDLLEVFDGNDSFHDMDMIKTESTGNNKSASKKRGRTTKDKNGGDELGGVEDVSAMGAAAANPPKKKTKKNT